MEDKLLTVKLSPRQINFLLQANDCWRRQFRKSLIKESIGKPLSKALVDGTEQEERRELEKEYKEAWNNWKIKYHLFQEQTPKKEKRPVGKTTVKATIKEIIVKKKPKSRWISGYPDENRTRSAHKR